MPRTHQCHHLASQPSPLLVLINMTYVLNKSLWAIFSFPTRFSYCLLCISATDSGLHLAQYLVYYKYHKTKATLVIQDCEAQSAGGHNVKREGGGETLVSQQTSTRTLYFLFWSGDLLQGPAWIWDRQSSQVFFCDSGLGFGLSYPVLGRN